MAISTSPGSTAISLLCVDDDPQILTLLKTVLMREPGFNVETSTSAQDALDILGTRHFDAILSDYSMPEMNGIGLLREIRSRGIPALFVIFTGWHNEQIAIDTLNNGGNFYLQKGSEFTEDIQKLIDFIKSHRANGIPDEELSSGIARSGAFAKNHIDLLAAFHPDGTIAFVNELCSRSIGIQNGNISPSNFFMRIPEDERTEVKAIIRGLSPEKPGIYIEHSTTGFDNKPRLIQWGYFVVFDKKKGSVKEILAQGHDVSKIIHIGEKTRAGPEGGEKNRVSSYETDMDRPAKKTAELTDLNGLGESVENLPYPVFATNSSGVLIAWNSAIAELTGIAAKDMIGKGGYAYAVPFYNESRPMLADYILNPERISGMSLPPIIKREGDAVIGKPENITLRGRHMLMGGRATAIRNGSGSVIAAVQSIHVSGHHRTGTIETLCEEEQYLGGVSSVILKITGKGFSGAIAGAIGSATGGYGVYATDRRLFVAHNPEICPARDEGIHLGKFIVDELFGTNVDLGVRSIPELERMKIFEVWRNDLVSIEMKKPRLLAGHLIFQTRNGESFRIYIDHMKAFAHLEQLMMLFYPEILKDTTRTIEDLDLAWFDEVRTFDLIGNEQVRNPLYDKERLPGDIPVFFPPVKDNPKPSKTDYDQWSELRLAIEPIQYPIFAIDAAGNVIAWNSAIETLTGVAAGTISGKGGHAYAVPFYGEARRMLIDFIGTSSDASVPGTSSEITRDGDTITGDLETVTIQGKPVEIWGKCTGIYDSNGSLIAAIQSILVKKLDINGESGENPEKYIGGISSITIKIGRKDAAGAFAGAIGSTTGGYGVYVTDQRLFIIHNPELDASTKYGPRFGAFLVEELFGTTVDTGPRSIHELELRMIVEIARKNIASIEMKKPNLLAGYLILKIKTGESFRVNIDHKRAYTHLDQLLKMFYPEITRFE